MNVSLPSSSTEDKTSSRISALIRLCAIGLFVNFFLPWIQLMGQGSSGFDLQRMSENLKWLWIMPVFSMITVFVPATGRCQKVVALITGALPFCVLVYWLNALGSDLLRILGLGGWLSLISGLTLFILAWRLK